MRIRNRVALIALLATTAIVAPSIAAAKPVLSVLTVIAPIVLTAAFPFFGTIAGTLILGAGLFLASKLIAPSTPRPQSADPADILGNFAQATSYFERVYGRVRKGGPIGFTGFKDGRRHYAVIIAAHSTRGPHQHWLDERPADTDGAGLVTTAPMNGMGSIRTYTGKPGQTADAQLVAAFQEWTASHNFAGLSYAALWAKRPSQDKFTQVYPSGREWAYTPVWDGCDTILDPRTGLRGWTDNAALIIADWIVEVLGQDVDWDAVALEADFCDGLVETRSGTLVKRWTLNGVLNDSQDLEEQRSALVLACDAFMWESTDGRVGFQVGRWTEPTLTLTDADFLTLTASEGSWGDQAPTETVVRYVEPEAGWREVPSAAWVITEGDERRREEKAARFISNHNQAVRIAKRLASIARARYKIQGTLRLSGYRLIGRRFVRVEHAALGLSLAIEIDALRRADDGLTFEFEAHSVSAEDFAFDSETEEPTRPAYGRAASDDTIPAVAGVAASALAGFSFPAVEISWTAAGAEYDQQVQYRLQGAPDWILADIPDGQPRFTLSQLIDGETYEIQVRNRTAARRAGPWSPASPITVVAIRNSTPPAGLTAFSALALGSDVSVDFRTANDPLHHATRIVRADYAPGYAGPFNISDASLLTTRFTGPNTVGEFNDNGLSPGVYAYWGRPINASGVEGPISGEETVEIT